MTVSQRKFAICASDFGVKSDVSGANEVVGVEGSKIEMTQNGERRWNLNSVAVDFKKYKSLVHLPLIL